MAEVAEDPINLSKRQLPRANCTLPVAYEIVEWDDFNLSDLQLPQWTTCKDISAIGIGFSTQLHISPLARYDLDRGIKKMRLAINLPAGSKPILAFARLVWGCNDKTRNSGLHFMELPAAHFHRLGDFVGRLIDPR